MECSGDAYRIPVGIARAGTAGSDFCTDDVEIVESEPTEESRLWEPPIWVIALGFCAALLVGLVQSGQVRDPRLVNVPSLTPCVEWAQSVWTLCP